MIYAVCCNFVDILNFILTLPFSYQNFVEIVEIDKNSPPKFRLNADRDGTPLSSELSTR